MGRKQTVRTYAATGTEERTETKKRKPDMNAAATSAKEAQQEEKKAVKKEKKDKKGTANQNGQTPRQEPVRSGPVSNLKSIKAGRKRFAKGSKSGKQGEQGQASVASKDVQQSQKNRQKEKDSSTLDDINPYVIGQRSRALLENVWKRFVSLGAPGSVSTSSDSLDSMDAGNQDPDVYVAPEASVTNVLVIGATGRVGRVLVRKLQLRGYPVSVLVRPNQSETTYFPESIKVLTGEVGDYQTMRAAMQGIDKVIYVASARTPLTAEIARVSEVGVMTAAKALQDERNDGITPSAGGLKPFGSAKIRITGARQSDRITKRRTRWQGWQITHTGPPSESRLQQESRARKYSPVIQDKSELWLNKRQNLIFSGNLFTRTSYATCKLDLDNSGLSLAETVGLVIRVKGDKQTYAVVLTLENGDSYTARYTTTGSFQNIRIPYKAFRRTEETVGEAPQQLDPGSIRSLTLRVDLKNQIQTRKAKGGKELTSLSDSNTEGAFRLEVNRVHALPAGSETDFILLSCAGVKPRDVVDADVFDTSVRVKRLGEEKLRCSGLAYTIIRPGPIIDEPGGYKALVFDQGNRIQQSISRADVADVCVKSLHDPAARNKTFDVCHEFTPESGIEKYELVAHLPDKANSYLTPALINLERET